MIFRTCPSFINLFPDHFFFEKIKFLYKWSCRQEPPIFVRNVVFACSSASGIHHYFTVQLYTTWRHPGLSFVYETSLTIRWLKKMMMKNCHVLPMSLLTRGAWEKYRKINGITLTNKNSTDSTPNSMELKCDCGEYEMIYGDSVRQQVNVYKGRFQ